MNASNYIFAFEQQIKNDDSLAKCRRILPSLTKNDLKETCEQVKHDYCLTPLAYPGDYVFYDDLYDGLSKGMNLSSSIRYAKDMINADIKIGLLKRLIRE